MFKINCRRQVQSDLENFIVDFKHSQNCANYSKIFASSSLSGFCYFVSFYCVFLSTLRASMHTVTLILEISYKKFSSFQ